ncbi:hypothetical protein QFC19_008845 [Naganishia cerealis]|uniref:Uncharacterized protein n=1 Tax=Naganishia cerealis TaxID=610337 RepID=A0ACC2UZM9_9TREE|nr:hypothetical protein QFC19_008845 [Naganishia cerealis]
MEGLGHYDDPTAGWPDPEHTTLQQAVAALAAAAAAQDQHGLHHHHHAFGDLGSSSGGPDVSRAPGSVGQHVDQNTHDDTGHNITLAGAAAAAGGINIPLSTLDLANHPHLPPFPQHLGNSGFSIPGPHVHMPMHPPPGILDADQVAAEAKKREKKERKRREKEEAKRHKAEAELQAMANSNPSIPQPTQLQLIRPDEALAVSKPAAENNAGPSQIPAIPAAPKRARSEVTHNDPTDAIVRRAANGDDEGPITNVNEWLAGSWLKGPALRKVAKERGVNLSVHLRKGKFTSQEEKLVDDAITEYLSSRGLTRERHLTQMLFGDGGDPLLGDGEAGGNDGAGGTQGQKTRAKNKDRVDLVKAIAPSIPGRPLTSINAFIVRKYDPYVRKGPWTAQEDADLLAAYQQYGPSWDKISRIVERNETDCRVRYTNHLQIKQTRKRGLWSAEEEEMLQRTIADVCKAHKTTIKDTPNRPVPWAVVVKLMGGQRNALECREKWFDQVLPRLMAQEQTASTAASESAAHTANPAENPASDAPAGATAPTPVSRLPRAMEWTQADFLHLLKRIADVLGPDLSQVYQRDINFRTLHAMTPDLQKFSYKHCYKTFRAYAKRVDGFETLPLSELLPRLEALVTSKFRSGGPRSGSAILRRTRAPPVERSHKETKSQEMVEDDDSASEPESDSSPPADDAFSAEDNHMDPSLNDGAMTTEMHQQLPLDESLIDPALMDLDEPTMIDDMVSTANITLADAAAESAVAEAEAEVDIGEQPVEDALEGAEHVDEQAVMEQTEDTTGKKRKHREDGEKKAKKRSKKEKAKEQTEESSVPATPQGQPVEQPSASISNSTDSSNISVGASEDAETVIDQSVGEPNEAETQRLKEALKEAKRKRKEEKRARKEAKRQRATQSTQVMPADDANAAAGE